MKTGTGIKDSDKIKALDAHSEGYEPLILIYKIYPLC